MILTNQQRGDNRLRRKGIGMTNFSDMNDRMMATMGELVEALLPYASPEVRAKFKEPEHKCRGCDGHGDVSFTVSPNDPRDEFEVSGWTCPECFGDQTVDQAKHDEQHEYGEEAFHKMVSEAAFELWHDIETDGYL